MGYTRRDVLAGIGGGSLAVGGFTLTQRPRRFAQYTYAAPDDDTSDGLLRVAWYETYNGAFVENHAGASDGADATLDPGTAPAYVEEATLVTDVSGPVIAMGDVLPGDSGTLVVGLEVVGETTTPLDVWFHASTTVDADNRVNEPEQVAGDTTPDDGELDDETLVELWVDDSPLGGCNGVLDVDESLRTPLVARAPIGDAFAPTSDAGDADGRRVFECLEPGALRCIALSWELPKSASNRIQGDSLGFDFAFAGTGCGGDSPFVVGGSR